VTETQFSNMIWAICAIWYVFLLSRMLPRLMLKHVHSARKTKSTVIMADILDAISQYNFLPRIRNVYPSFSNLLGVSYKHQVAKLGDVWLYTGLPSVPGLYLWNIFHKFLPNLACSFNRKFLQTGMQKVLNISHMHASCLLLIVQ